MRRFLTRQNIMLALGVISIVAVAMWGPISQQFLFGKPVDVRAVTRKNDALLNGTLAIPKSGITLDDGTVLDSVVAIGRRGDVLISNGNGDKTYHIVWLQDTNDYLVSIQKEPFEQNRERAESDFLKILGKGSIESACTYPVFVQPAQWLTFRQPEGLSYCTQ